MLCLEQSVHVIHYSIHYSLFVPVSSYSYSWTIKFEKGNFCIFEVGKDSSHSRIQLTPDSRAKMGIVKIKKLAAY